MDRLPASCRGYEKAKNARWAVFLDIMATRAEEWNSKKYGYYASAVTKEAWMYVVRYNYRCDVPKKGVGMKSFESYLKREKRKCIKRGVTWPGITQQEWLETVRELFEDEVEDLHYREYLGLRPIHPSRPKIPVDAEGPSTEDWDHRDISSVHRKHAIEVPGNDEGIFFTTGTVTPDPSKQDLDATFAEYVAYECLYLDWLRHRLHSAGAPDAMESDPGSTLDDLLECNIEMREKIRNWAFSEMEKMKYEIEMRELYSRVPRSPAKRGPLKRFPNFIKDDPSSPVVEPETPKPKPTLKEPKVKPTIAPVGGRTSRRLAGQPPEFDVLLEVIKKRPKKPAATTGKVAKPKKTPGAKISEKEQVLKYDHPKPWKKARGRPPKSVRAANPKP